MISLEEKLKTLKSLIASYGSCAIAFSSGVDSTFLSYVTKEVLNDKAILISANVNTLTSRDTEDIISYSKNIGLKLVTISCDQLAIDNFVNNPPKRCYFCKYNLFSKIKETAKRNSIDTVIDGTNASDCNDYRPGIKALEELNIKSPLKICGFTKKEIRDLLKAWNIDAFNKPSSGCLATRIPYFENITQEKLDIIRKCEDYLLNLGLTDIRVRLQNGTARIEVNPKNRSYFFNTSIMDNIYKTFISFGCSYVSLDLRGYKTGSLNEILDKGTNQNE